MSEARGASFVKFVPFLGYEGYLFIISILTVIIGSSLNERYAEISKDQYPIRKIALKQINTFSSFRPNMFLV